MISKDRSYEDYNQYIIYNKKDFSKFLDENFDAIKKRNSKIKTKKHYLDQYQDDIFTKAEHRAKRTFKLDTLYTIFDEKIEKKYQDFFILNRNQKKTLFYMPSQITGLISDTLLIEQMAEQLNDYNIVFINASKPFYGKKSYKKAELENEMIKELKEVIDEKKFKKTEKVFNVICYAFLPTYKFFSENHEYYDKVVYYSPMVSFEDKTTFHNHYKKIEYMKTVDFFFEEAIKEDRPKSKLVYSKQEEFFNTKNIFMFTDIYEQKGIKNLKNIKSKALILSDNDKDNQTSKEELFDAKAILKNSYHADFLVFKPIADRYIEEFKKLVKALK